MMKMKRIAVFLVPAIAVLLAAVSCLAAEYSFTAADPVGDDYGPGGYLYPTNPVFYPGAFDLTGLQVKVEGESLVFRITLAAEIANGWGGPNGVSAQLFQIYIDKDHKKGSGFADAIPGANVFFAPESAWEFGIIAEGGWGDEVERLLSAHADEDMAKVIFVAHDCSANGNVFTVRVPLSAVGIPDRNWGYQVLVMGQEGSAESMEGIKVRRILKERTEWQFGGGDESGYGPNVIDVFTAKGQDQKAILGGYSVEKDTFAVVGCLYQ